MPELAKIKRALGSPAAYAVAAAPSLLYRRWTSHRRVLPQVFLIGAPRCGTTSMAVYLARHPSYLPALNPELWFLQDMPTFRGNQERNRLLHWLWGRFEQGEDSYRKFFPTKRRMRAVEQRTGSRSLTGDHTPFYLYCPVAMKRIAELSPEARFIVMLRDPVSRTYSDYNVQRTYGRGELRSFEQALEDEISGRCRDFRLNYLYQGTYEPHLRRWLATYPRERFLIIDSHEMFADPAPAVARAYEFLSLAPHRPGKLRAWNQLTAKPMNELIRRRLQDYFAPSNEALVDLLDMEFRWSRAS